MIGYLLVLTARMQLACSFSVKPKAHGTCDPWVVLAYAQPDVRLKFGQAYLDYRRQTWF
jgi:hypothetical protein